MVFSATDESIQARQNALVCQAMPGELTPGSIVGVPLSTTPETDNYKRFQREA